MFTEQWKREQDFDLQLLERAVQGEEAHGVRSVQGEERPPEHKERPRPHSDEWLTFCSTAMSPPTDEVDLEPLNYDVDLNKEVQEVITASWPLSEGLNIVRRRVEKLDDISNTVTSSSPCEALGPSKNNVSFLRIIGGIEKLLFTHFFCLWGSCLCPRRC